MILEINKLINSGYTYFKEIGMFFYSRDLNKGLSKDEVIELLEKLANYDGLEEEIEKEAFESGYRAGYEQGYEDGNDEDLEFL
jgi:hypothetical protein